MAYPEGQSDGTDLVLSPEERAAIADSQKGEMRDRMLHALFEVELDDRYLDVSPKNQKSVSSDATVDQAMSGTFTFLPEDVDHRVSYAGQLGDLDAKTNRRTELRSLMTDRPGTS